MSGQLEITTMKAKTAVKLEELRTKQDLKQKRKDQRAQRRQDRRDSR